MRVLRPELGKGLDRFGAVDQHLVICEVLYRWWSPLLRPLSGLAGFAVAAVFGVTPAMMLAAPGECWRVVLFWLPALVARHSAEGRRRYMPWFWLGIASFTVAYATWLTGTAEHDLCRPDSLIPTYAIWQLVTAFATWSFFMYFRTERPVGVEAERQGELVVRE